MFSKAGSGGEEGFRAAASALASDAFDRGVGHAMVEEGTRKDAATRVTVQTGALRSIVWGVVRESMSF